MKTMIFFKKTAAALLIAAISFAGCKKEEDWSDEIGDLQRRMAEVEALSDLLKQKVDAGYLVESVTALAGGGWKIEFTDGDPIEVSDTAGNTFIEIGANGNWFIDGADTGIAAAGADGSVITIGANGNWYIDGTDTGNPSRGADGAAGTVGSTLTIGANGNWFLNGTDTGVKAAGEDGAPGADGSAITIGANGNWCIDGADTGVKAAGEDGTPGADGSTITIGTNGNWCIDGADTGRPSRGEDGATPHIDATGNWFIGDTDTGIPATGPKGADGEKGDKGDAGDSKIYNIAQSTSSGMVTITMNDDAKTQHTFRKAHLTVSFAILNAGKIEIVPGTTFSVWFTVNPSNAYISTNPANWAIYDAATGAAPANLTLEYVTQRYYGVEPVQYTASIRHTAAANTATDIALKMNAGTAAAPAWISSSAFEIGIAAPNITMTTSRTSDFGYDFRLLGTGPATIDWGDGTSESFILTSSAYLPHTWEDGAETHRISIYGQNITQLECWDMQLSSLDVSNNTALEILYCPYNQLSILDVSNNPALKELWCDNNRLVSLYRGGRYTALEWLDCSNNRLTSLDVNGCAGLKELWCNNNRLTSLGVGGCTALERLECFRNQISSLDVSDNNNLTILQCEENRLTSLDASNNTALTVLDCSLNQLTSLDVSANTALTSLDCPHNQLSSLDVSANTVLRHLDCRNNQLTSLDATHNTVLLGLWVSDNEFTAAELNTLFGTLHDGTIPGYRKVVYIYGNPGYSGCHEYIATGRGWEVSW